MKSSKRKITPDFLKFNSYISSYGKKKIVLLLLVVCIPSLLIGTAIYFLGANQLKDEMIKTHREQITNQVNYIDSQLRGVEINLNYLSHERLFRNELDQVNFQENYQLTEQLSGTLFSKQNSNTLIETVSMYIDSERPSVFNPQFRWVSEDLIPEYRRYLSSNEDFYWERNFLRESNDTHVFPLVLIKNLPSYRSLSSESAVSFIIELNHDAVMQMIDGLSLSSEGFSFIIDQRTGMMVSSTASSSQFFEEILINEGLEKDSFTTNWNAVDYSVTSGTISRVNSDWVYMSVVPISFITEPVQELSQVIIVTSLIGLALSFILANVTFHSIYQPIGRIVDMIKSDETDSSNAIDLIQNNWNLLNNEKEVLEDNVDQLNQKLISNFFFQLIEGFLAEESEENLRDRLKQYNVELSNKKIIFMDIETINKRQKKLIADRIDQEEFAEYYPVHFNDRFMGIVFLLESEILLRNQIYSFFESLKTENHFDIIIIHISQIVQDLSDVFQAVEQIRLKKYKKSVYKQTSLIWLSEVIEELKKNVSHIYPFTIEKDVLQAIEFGNSRRVAQLVDQFIDRLVEQDERTIQYSFIQLYASIQSQIIKDGFYPFELFKGKNILKKFMTNYNIQSLKKSLIEDMIEPYMEKKQAKEISEQEHIVKEAMKYIKSNYMRDISLEECADELGLNSYTLSKWFKIEKKVNFIEYLTNFRMEKAKELLLSTNQNIGDIAEAVGYQNSYFNRIFKKHFDLTPGQYRKKFQKLNHSILIK